MEIVAIRSSTVLSDRRVHREYLLSSPVTQEVLVALSKGNHIFTGYQYLSPTYTVTRTDCSISGILDSPIITVDSLPGMSAGIEDYLSGYLSTIADSERA